MKNLSLVIALSSWNRAPFSCKFLLQKSNFCFVFRALPVSAFKITGSKYSYAKEAYLGMAYSAPFQISGAKGWAASFIKSLPRSSTVAGNAGTTKPQSVGLNSGSQMNQTYNLIK